MPKIIKKKCVQKKIVQEGEVKGFALDAFDAIKSRQKQVIIGAAVFAAILAAYMTFAMYSSSLEADAVAIEMKANDYYYGQLVQGSMSAEEQLKKAREFYKESVDVNVTFTALYNLGNTYYKLGDFDNAIKQYEVVIDKFRRNEEIISLAYQKIAASHVRAGRNDKAFEALKKLANVRDGAFKDTALVLEARYLENAGDTEKSLEKYRELIAEFPASPWNEEAVAKFPQPEAATEKKVEVEVKAEEKVVEAEKKEESGEVKEEQ